MFFPALICFALQHQGDTIWEDTGSSWHTPTTGKLCSERVAYLNSQDTHSSEQRHNY